MSADLLELSAAAAVAAIERGELSATELFALYRERAQADANANGEGLNCFTWVAEESPPAAAGPLAGVPLAVKDLFCTKGVPSQSGSRILEGYRPPYTASSVQALSDAGATLLAKTNQDEFAMGSSTENSAYGPTLNPWDRTRVPGGSSGGSAAAVAAGLAPWALGTDTGGSIRQPAALCGIVGLKPTYGSVSRYGMIAFASSLDQAGPLTRDVTDAALLLKHMVGRDPCDATSLEFPHEIEQPSATRLDGLRLGVPAELRAEASSAAGGETGGVEPGVREAFERALKLAQELGASVEEVRLPHAPHALSAYYVLAPSEASSNLARFDGVRYGMRAAEATDLLEMYTRTRHDGFGPEVKRRIMLGTYALSSGYYDAYYGRAQRVRTKIAEDFRTAFERVDLIVTPTSANVAFGLGEKTADPWAMYLSDYFTVPMSLAGIPAISIPCGLSEGLPVGLQIAGPAFSENRLLDASYALEQALEFGEGAARV
ncbi:MAG TPA: Asp-tRNA(Asn)/Glu-tRNA(Gln) amidotransferase subunit GatA [Solirubrobacteraceae bacterium]|jgi:aspartyl-tRNA(Asn)/glutamyl-tRNA(Gln) amidotransferase subunit A|nr:Asp-tRNA(Asn)/Glu-tRNA(Gln) amidotransferase subunit GatA [Solirubrobacteraceae bacterium]